MSKFLSLTIAAVSGAIVTLLIVKVASLDKTRGELATTSANESRAAIDSTPAEAKSNSNAALPVASTPPSVAEPHSNNAQTMTNKNIPIDARPASEVDQAQMLNQMRAQHEQRVIAHNRELRDQQWSYRMETKLQGGFQSIPEGSLARVGKPDCRSQTCAVEITWPSLDAAKQELTLPSQLVASIPCSNSVVLPVDTSGGGEYRATMLVDCTGHQAEAAN